MCESGSNRLRRPLSSASDEAAMAAVRELPQRVSKINFSMDREPRSRSFLPTISVNVAASDRRQFFPGKAQGSCHDAFSSVAMLTLRHF